MLPLLTRPLKITLRTSPLSPNQYQLIVKKAYTVSPPRLRKLSKNSRSNSNPELNFNIELVNKFNPLENTALETQQIAATPPHLHATNIVNNKPTHNSNPTTTNLPPHTMLKITDDFRTHMKLLTTKMPYIRSKKTGQYIKLYTDTFDQRHKLNTLLENAKFPHYTITPKTQRPIKVVIKGLPHDASTTGITNDLIDLGFTVDRIPPANDPGPIHACPTNKFNKYFRFPPSLTLKANREKEGNLSTLR
ncbi:hypothetical protein TNIN_146041 [Trichonephila inaurata madagascariensis]|uniref:Uncharacterized protein n=1 Tax=Trichonephila inaurata madagascariensis TaxID=2747483 RepID=A0A8X6Y118_9ARAC|nr:hypothetical protein TNIN_146041 [Trichonephila inaurata madagascariensis]